MPQAYVAIQLPPAQVPIDVGPASVADLVELGTPLFAAHRFEFFDSHPPPEIVPENGDVDVF